MQLKWPMLWDLFSLFPAHAGVIPIVAKRLSCQEPFPRTRGGDPGLMVEIKYPEHFSPHTRG